jgi:hypothetical protein
LEVAVPKETFVHGLKDMCAELDKRIAKLDQFREKVQRKVDANIAVAHNTETLKRVMNSLDYAYQARKAMQSSCCDYSCNYELDDV